MGGALDVEALNRSLKTIICRHESLRTTFSYLEGSPAQIINKTAEVPLPVINLSALSVGEREIEGAKIGQRGSQAAF